MEDTASPKRLFILEGRTDKITVCSVLEKLNILNVERDVKFEECNGIENLLRDFPVFIKESDMKSIGIIVDANSSLESRWQSIRNKLIRSDLEIELPETPCHHGTIQEFGNQIIGIWVMPDNQRCGVLEDFVAELISEDDIWELACDFVEKAKDIEKAKDKGIQISESKSRIYAWLAIVVPEMRMGTAFKANKLKLDTTNYKNFENWIKNLCG